MQCVLGNRAPTLILNSLLFCLKNVSLTYVRCVKVLEGKGIPFPLSIASSFKYFLFLLGKKIHKSDIEEEEDDTIHMGNAIMTFYAALIDLLGRCAPEMHVSLCGEWRAAILIPSILKHHGWQSSQPHPKLVIFTLH